MRLFHQLNSVVAILLMGAGAAFSQDYPNKPVHFVVPSAPGTVADAVGRLVAPDMSKFIGQTILVENKPGANYLIGYDHVARQMPADGYTVSVAFIPALATLPLMSKDLRFDPLRDLPPVVGLADGPYIFGSASKLPWKTFNELIAHAKANPGKLNYGASSPGARLSTEALIRGAGLSVVYIPYAGSASPYFTGLMSGEVHMGFVGESTAVSFGDKFRVLAVTGSKRLASFPDAPPLAEFGYPQIRGLGFSLNVRLGTPKTATDKLLAGALQTLKLATIKAQFAKLQLDIAEQSPEDAARRLADDARLFADIARKIGFQPE